jgi:folate-binding protein YgfZ
LAPTLDLEASYGLIREAACALETFRDAVIVRGPDARSWLQGQVSQDLAPLGVGDSAETLVLSPQGKLEAYCRVSFLDDDVVVLDTETDYGEALLQRLKRFRLRVKAELDTGTLGCLSVRGPASAAVLESSGLALGLSGGGKSFSDEWKVAVPVDWPGYAGFDVLFSGALEVRLAGVSFGDPAAFEVARIEAGLPAMGRELTAKTIPQEAGSLSEHAVSFTKGCYTGQELVARLDARGGNVAWRLRGVVLEPSAKTEIGATLLSVGREVGRITSVAWSPGFRSQVALAYVRRDVTPPAQVTVAPEQLRAEIREIPLDFR